VDWIEAMRMQHLKRRHKRLLEDSQILSTSPRHKIKRSQEKKVEDSRSGLLCPMCTGPRAQRALQMALGQLTDQTI
jgi:hypothetical protein